MAAAFMAFIHTIADSSALRVAPDELAHVAAKEHADDAVW